MHGRLNAGGALAALGAGVLLLGLFLDWFEPGISAWNAFEIVDLLLAAIALGVLLVSGAGSPERPRLQALAPWLPAAAVTAFVLVTASLLNPPPAVPDGSLEIGAWISLAGAALLLVGAALATTELSIVLTARPRRRDPAGEGGVGAEDGPVEAVAPPTSDPGWEPPGYGSVGHEAPLEEPLPDDLPLEEPLPEEPFEEPPLEEPPVEEPESEELAVDGGGLLLDEEGLAEPVEEIDPRDAEAETQPLRRRDRR